MRNDDEIELANDISGPAKRNGSLSSAEDLGIPHGGIMVKSDMSWSSTQQPKVNEGC